MGIRKLIFMRYFEDSFMLAVGNPFEVAFKVEPPFLSVDLMIAIARPFHVVALESK